MHEYISTNSPFDTFHLDKQLCLHDIIWLNGSVSVNGRIWILDLLRLQNRLFLDGSASVKLPFLLVETHYENFNFYVVV